MKQVEWYFDFISPFAYLQSTRLEEMPADLDIVLRPILFAGVLDHWQTRGPAEIPEMRRFTYRYVQWYAKRWGIPLKMPAAHPFNPIRLLRLALAAGCTRESVTTIFKFVWAEGHLPEDGKAWRKLTRNLNLDDAEARIAEEPVKSQLRANTEEAIGHGVFGVPTFRIDDVLFWGEDATDMLFDYLDDPKLLQSPEMQRISNLPVGIERREKPG
jgi:2-hydroxychromene-2-carboxylate isomerase